MNQMFRLDTDRAEGFEGRMVGMINEGALCLMISIGHRTGLFDTMTKTGWANSAEIARAASLQERYVREWLGAMTVGRIVDHDPDAGTYRLPPEHARLLTRDGDGGNMAVAAQVLPVLAAVETDILACFHKGPGVPSAHFHRFPPVLTAASTQPSPPAPTDSPLPLHPHTKNAKHKSPNQESVKHIIFAVNGYVEKMRLDISWWIRQFSAPGGFSGPSYGRFTFSENGVGTNGVGRNIPQHNHSNNTNNHSNI